MRFLLLAAAAAIALGAVGQRPARAQEWHGPPVVSENYARAYHHFVNAPSPYRTFSGSAPGYVVYRPTPFGYEAVFVPPTYVHQRITPRGFESYSTVPGTVVPAVSPYGFLVRPTRENVYVPAARAWAMRQAEAQAAMPYGGFYLPANPYAPFAPGFGR
jgi:hypothetical protein